MLIIATGSLIGSQPATPTSPTGKQDNRSLLPPNATTPYIVTIQATDPRSLTRLLRTLYKNSHIYREAESKETAAEGPQARPCFFLHLPNFEAYEALPGEDWESLAEEDSQAKAKKDQDKKTEKDHKPLLAAHRSQQQKNAAYYYTDAIVTRSDVDSDGKVGLQLNVIIDAKKSPLLKKVQLAEAWMHKYRYLTYVFLFSTCSFGLILGSSMATGTLTSEMLKYILISCCGTSFVLTLSAAYLARCKRQEAVRSYDLFKNDDAWREIKWSVLNEGAQIIPNSHGFTFATRLHLNSYDPKLLREVISLIDEPEEVEKAVKHEELLRIIIDPQDEEYLEELLETGVPLKLTIPTHTHSGKLIDSGIIT